MVGTNEHEFAGLGVPLAWSDAEVAALPERLEDLIADDFPDRPGLAADYRKAFEVAAPGASQAEVVGGYLTDRTYRQPSNRLLAARSLATGATYGYLFRWEPREARPRVGAVHGGEVSFLFRHQDHPQVTEVLGPKPPEWLADALSAAWTSFAATGRPVLPDGPDWPQYRIEDRKTMIIGDRLEVVGDPRGELRTLLAHDAPLGLGCLEAAGQDHPGGPDHDLQVDHR
ncbi:carboxylesterase family protein [Microlunatus parietis]|uniref:Carboxylesterase type B n=1 Tax=Microlunatus parietis TaxID=682979 RepID=A0A7Y9I1Y8_9ACTN|nr:carboxylesterase family protein [Microlunatus parietis]NYE68767.1 carboxylesterase type B [Microlunatus parietis]